MKLRQNPGHRAPGIRNKIGHTQTRENKGKTVVVLESNSGFAFFFHPHLVAEAYADFSGVGKGMYVPI